jgi:hypothetical protein
MSTIRHGDASDEKYKLRSSVKNAGETGMINQL